MLNDMEKILKENRINYTKLDKMTIGKKTFNSSVYVVGKFWIMVIQDNADRRYLQNLENAKQVLKEENKQLLIFKEKEIKNYTKMVNMLSYFQEYSPVNF